MQEMFFKESKDLLKVLHWIQEKEFFIWAIKKQ